MEYTGTPIITIWRGEKDYKLYRIHNIISIIVENMQHSFMSKIIGQHANSKVAHLQVFICPGTE